MLSDPAKAAAGGVSREECAVATYEGATAVAGGVIARISYLPSGMRSSMEHDIARGDAPELDANAGPILLGAAKGGIALRATPELIGEIAQNPTFSKELEETLMLEVILKRFEKPDEVRTFEKGKFELLQVGGMTIGRATYEPGWKVVRTRGSRARQAKLRRRARRNGYFRTSHCSHGRWTCDRNETRRRLLHSTWP